jgi:hypothetical protein
MLLSPTMLADVPSKSPKRIVLCCGAAALQPHSRRSSLRPAVPGRQAGWDSGRQQDERIEALTRPYVRVTFSLGGTSSGKGSRQDEGLPVERNSPRHRAIRQARPGNPITTPPSNVKSGCRHGPLKKGCDSFLLLARETNPPPGRPLSESPTAPELSHAPQGAITPPSRLCSDVFCEKRLCEKRLPMMPR